MKKLLLLLAFLSSVGIANAFEAYPDKITVFTNEPYFYVKVMLRNTDTDPVIIYYRNQSVYLNGNEIKPATFKVKYGNDLVLETMMQRVTVKIDWVKDYRNVQQPEIEGWVIPMKWATVVDKIERANGTAYIGNIINSTQVNNNTENSKKNINYLVYAVFAGIVLFIIWFRRNVW